jgi:hypothetical protein
MLRSRRHRTANQTFRAVVVAALVLAVGVLALIASLVMAPAAAATAA